MPGRECCWVHSRYNNVSAYVMTVLLCLYTKALCSIKGNEKYLHGFAQSASLAENAWRCGIVTMAKMQSLKELCRLMLKSHSHLKQVRCWPDPGLLGTINPVLWYGSKCSLSMNYAHSCWVGQNDVLDSSAVCKEIIIQLGRKNTSKERIRMAGRRCGFQMSCCNDPDSNGKWSEVKWKSLSRIWLFAIRGLYSPWNSPGQNTGVGSLSLLQGIFPTQGSNPGLPHCRWICYQLSHREAQEYWSG